MDDAYDEMKHKPVTRPQANLLFSDLVSVDSVLHALLTENVLLQQLASVATGPNFQGWGD